MPSGYNGKLLSILLVCTRHNFNIRGDYSSFSHLLVCLIRLEVFRGSAACLRTQCAARQGNPFNIVSNSKEGCLKPTFIVFTNVAKIWTNGMFSTTRVYFCIITKTAEVGGGKPPADASLWKKIRNLNHPFSVSKSFWPSFMVILFVKVELVTHLEKIASQHLLVQNSTGCHWISSLREIYVT